MLRTRGSSLVVGVRNEEKKYWEEASGWEKLRAAGGRGYWRTMRVQRLVVVVVVVDKYKFMCVCVERTAFRPALLTYSFSPAGKMIVRGHERDVQAAGSRGKMTFK